MNDKLTAAIDAYNNHAHGCRHEGRTHAVTCWEGAALMRAIEAAAQQAGAR